MGSSVRMSLNFPWMDQTLFNVYTLVIDESLEPAVVKWGEVLHDLELDVVPVLGERLSVSDDEVTNVTSRKSDDDGRG